MQTPIFKDCLIINIPNKWCVRAACLKRKLHKQVVILPLADMRFKALDDAYPYEVAHMDALGLTTRTTARGISYAF